MTFFKSVFKSVFNRRDVKIFLSFMFIPILVPVLSEFMEGTSSGLMGSFLSFLAATISSQFRLILPVLLFSLVISSVFTDEIDTGIMFLYKDINRKKIFNAKLQSLLAIYFIFFLGTVVISLISYYGFMLPKGEVSADFIARTMPEALSTIFLLLSTIALNIITTALVAMVSVKSKVIQSVLSGVFFSLLTSVAPMLIGIKYIVPNGYVELSKTNLPLSSVLAVSISIAYFVTFYIKGKKRFEKVEF